MEPSWDLARKRGQKAFLKALKTKFGPFPEGRFEAPMPIMDVGLQHTEERQAAFQQLVRTWRSNFNHEFATAGRAKIPAIHAPSGTGKTHIATIAAARGLLRGGVVTKDKDFEAVLLAEAAQDPTFVAALRKAVGVTVTFNFSTPLNIEYDVFDAKTAVASRMIYSHFVRGDSEDRWVAFCQFLARHHLVGPYASITPIAAKDLIHRDIVKNHDSDDRPLFLVVDEIIKLAESLPRSTTAAASDPVAVNVGAILQGLSPLYNETKNLFLLVTSLNKNKITSSDSGSQIDFAEFGTLSWAAVQTLARDHPQSALLASPVFTQLLREAAGVPRIVEKIFLAAKEGATSTPTGLLREQVLDAMDCKAKWEDPELREQALLVSLIETRNMFVGSSETKRRQEMRAELLGAGYVYPVCHEDRIHVGIPAVFLMWWEHAYAEAEDKLRTSTANIVKHSFSTSNVGQCSPFEWQLVHMWNMLVGVHNAWRRPSTAASKVFCPHDEKPITVSSIFGCSALGAAGNAFLSPGDTGAAFNRALADIPNSAEVVRRDFVQPFSISELPYGVPVLPELSNNPGFDAAVWLQTARKHKFLVLMEIKLLNKKLTPTNVADKLCKSFQRFDGANKVVGARDKFVKLFNRNRLVFVIGGGAKELPPFNDDLIRACVSKLKDIDGIDATAQNVSRCLMMLSREHTRALLSPTLCCIPPMADWVSPIDAAAGTLP